MFNEKFDVVTYNFGTTEEYELELAKPNHGSIGPIDAICRSTWLKADPYLNHFLFRDDLARKLPDSVKIIVSSGHGHDIVDVNYLSERGVIFCNSPDSCSRSTADVGVYLILSAFRYLTFAEKCVRTPGEYFKYRDIIKVSRDPKGNCLGIIGIGDIGIKVAEVCKALGMNIIYHNLSLIHI